MTSVKHILTLSFLLVSFVLSAINVSITTLSFNQEGPYLEIYSRVIGNSVQFVPAKIGSSVLKANIEFLLVLKQDKAVITADKFIMASPLLETPGDFWDLRRYSINPGEYNLELSYVDKNNISDTLVYKENLVIEGENENVYSSDLLLLSDISSEQDAYAFQKAGFSFEPLTYNMFDSKDETLIFYTELYNIPQDSASYYYSFVIKDNESGDFVTKPGFKKLGTAPDQQIMEDFSISDFKSGNYELEFEVKDKAMTSQYKSVSHFAVYHPLVDYRSTIKEDETYETSFVQILSEGEINYGLKAIFPRVTGDYSGLLAELIWTDDVEAKRYFLYNFWSQFSKDNASAVYNKYMEVAKAVDLKFYNSVGHGFESDRGYIFLKYGQPDDVVSVEDEPSAPPYEIWLYNFLEETKQPNVKFLFYNPSIVTNDYVLLHSTCRGEINNPQWEIKLYEDDRDAPIGHSIEATDVQDGFNRNARRYFSDF